MNKSLKLWLKVLALVVWLSHTETSAEAASFTGLGHLPGDDHSGARGISADGSTVVGYGSSEAFRWTESEGMVGLGPFSDGDRSDAYAVSADGSVVVGRYIHEGGDEGAREEAFYWTASEGMVGLGYLPGGGEFLLSKGRDVSSDGLTVVGESSGGGDTEAFRWTANDGMVGLGFLPGHNRSRADGISGDGSVVAGVSEGADPVAQAFRWTEREGMVGLDFLPGHFLSGAGGCVCRRFCGARR